LHLSVGKLKLFAPRIFRTNDAAEPYGVFTRSSKLPAKCIQNTRANAGRLLDVLWIA